MINVWTKNSVNPANSVDLYQLALVTDLHLFQMRVQEVFHVYSNKFKNAVTHVTHLFLFILHNN